jgi:hypothetical protein
MKSFHTPSFRRNPDSHTLISTSHSGGNRRGRKSDRHIIAHRKGIVPTALRAAFELMLVLRRGRLREWRVSTTAETATRLVAGRATVDLVRAWMNGRRRAPAWFVAVLVSELQRQIDHRQRILADLARYETGDRRKSPEARARARALRMRQLGRPIGQTPISDVPAPLEQPEKIDPIGSPQCVIRDRAV